MNRSFHYCLFTLLLASLSFPLASAQSVNPEPPIGPALEIPGGDAICAPGFIVERFPDGRPKTCSTFDATLDNLKGHYSACYATVKDFEKQIDDCRNQLNPILNDTLPCIDAGKVAKSGWLWKPTADPKARCKNGTTVLMSKSLQGVDKLELLDANGAPLANAEYFGLYSGSRPRFCFRFPGSKFGNSSVLLKYSEKGAAMCKRVANASKREE
jgi:hypothetical protein